MNIVKGLDRISLVIAVLVGAYVGFGLGTKIIYEIYKVENPEYKQYTEKRLTDRTLYEYALISPYSPRNPNNIFLHQNCGCLLVESWVFQLDTLSTHIFEKCNKGGKRFSIWIYGGFKDQIKKRGSPIRRTSFTSYIYIIHFPMIINYSQQLIIRT